MLSKEEIDIMFDLAGKSKIRESVLK